MEAIALTEFGANLASGLTMVAPATMELGVGIVVSGLTMVTLVTAELAIRIGKEEPRFTFAKKLEIWA